MQAQQLKDVQQGSKRDSSMQSSSQPGMLASCVQPRQHLPAKRAKQCVIVRHHVPSQAAAGQVKAGVLRVHGKMACLPPVCNLASTYLPNV